MTSRSPKWAPPYRNEQVDREPYDLIRYEKDAPVGRIVLNSPEKRNPLGYERLVQVAMAAKEMELDDEIKVIIIKGDGPSFSSGYDITPIQSGEPARNMPVDGYIHPDRDTIWGSYNAEHMRVYFTLWDLQKPVIAQIHGYCLAGGTELAAFCDLRVVAEDAQIGWPVGRNWSPGNLQYMPWLAGVTKAKYYMFTNTPMDGVEAYRCDWASAVFPAADLEEKTEELARQIALPDTDLIMLTKRSINRQLEVMGFRTGMDASNDLLSLSIGRPANRRREGDAFSTMAREQGLKAALDWRDKTFGVEYRTSQQAEALRAERQANAAASPNSQTKSGSDGASSRPNPQQNDGKANDAARPNTQRTDSGSDDASRPSYP